jgi:riboflavin synthase
VFTGIVEELGTVVSRDDNGHFRFGATVVTEDAKVGDSIAVNGCCLTVTDIGPGWWEATAVPETLSRTNLAALGPGDKVNFERPVRVTDRLGGHIVQGHIDAVGTIVTPAPDLHVAIPAELLRYVVSKGSITVDGCSLTVVSITDEGFTVAIIPHTAKATTLGLRGAGDAVNIEVDMVAKYVERLLAAHTEGHS